MGWFEALFSEPPRDYSADLDRLGRPEIAGQSLDTPEARAQAKRRALEAAGVVDPAIFAAMGIPIESAPLDTPEKRQAAIQSAQTEAWWDKIFTPAKMILGVADMYAGGVKKGLELGADVGDVITAGATAGAEKARAALKASKAPPAVKVGAGGLGFIVLGAAAFVLWRYLRRH